jgi:hypothetical protein
MAQEFTIKSQQIEDKINQLLPSQGGFQPGVDFSASTMVIPIVDLTETAEGSSLRQDLQTALSLTSATTFNVNNTTTTIISTTGYYRITAGFSMRTRAAGSENLAINLTDGVTTKAIWSTIVEGGGVDNNYINDVVDYIVFLEAGDSCTITASSQATIRGSSRQIADINGNLINP